ncbi:kinase inhibitor protein [Perkinsela sp. CCAP 1560/4]|nr:kinase inhibitor protein [Perkinsela sp. CCAP 1560/4]|eukprot:KNH04656.1 kinase inhibitor protein [Perkinsela sp. CCAP 1560/4]
MNAIMEDIEDGLDVVEEHPESLAKYIDADDEPAEHGEITQDKYTFPGFDKILAGLANPFMNVNSMEAQLKLGQSDHDVLMTAFQTVLRKIRTVSMTEKRGKESEN